jgi:hypothetical protein
MSGEVERVDPNIVLPVKKIYVTITDKDFVRKIFEKIIMPAIVLILYFLLRHHE